jgi:hypothetical protein
VAIFSGDDVQRAIDGCSTVAGAAYLRDRFPALLSSDPRQSLPAEWEFMLIDAFSRCCNIQWLAGDSLEEEPTEGTAAAQAKTNPDFLFSPGADTQLAALLPDQALIEVTAVSDAGYEDANPRQLFYNAFKRLLRDHRMAAKLFGVDIKGTLVRPPPRPGPWTVSSFLRPNLNHGKMRLLLPPKGKIEEFVRQYLGPWIKQIQNAPNNSATLQIREDVYGQAVHIEARYNPQGEYFSPGGFAGYTETYSIIHNPVANRLKRKVEQIRHSGVDGMAGVLLCDADCDLLANRGGYSPMRFDLNQVVTNFLNKHDGQRISFVITLSPQETMNWASIDPPRIKVQAFFNPNARHPINGETLNALIHTVCDKLPAPANTATNAVHLIEGRGGFPEGRPPVGGYKINSPITTAC